jgi:glycosyltransferase involved in cell wall biosynthesis
LRLLYVGRIAQGKGLETVIESLSLLKPHFGTTLVFDIVGPDDGLAAKLKSLVRDRNVESLVNFCGPATQSELAPFYLRSQIYVQPSRIEAFGLAILEAMTFGLPIIGSDQIPQELLVSGHNGLRCAFGDFRGLSECIRKLVLNPDLRREYGKESKGMAKHFSFETMVQNHVDIYKRVSTRDLDCFSGHFKPWH